MKTGAGAGPEKEAGEFSCAGVYVIHSKNERCLRSGVESLLTFEARSSDFADQLKTFACTLAQEKSDLGRIG
jgi:hypothetical protein